MDWGHYSTFVYEFQFAMCLVAWVLLCFDTLQAVKRVNRKRKEREQWVSGPAE